MFPEFDIGFLTVTWTDVLDIVLVSFVFYKLYSVMRGTIAVQIFVGLLLIIATSYIARAINLQALSWILRTLTDIWVIAFIILFQPELRRILVLLGRGKIMARFFKFEMRDSIEAIVEACSDMSQRLIGGLIVVERTTGIRTISETGISLRAEVSKHLLLSIFNPKSPLHDGAVIIKDRIIEAARCTLPLTAQLQIENFVMGMRHRSAVGISEQADVLVIVVSEETGIISMARDGKLTRRLTTDGLRRTLYDEFNIKASAEMTNGRNTTP